MTTDATRDVTPPDDGARADRVLLQRFALRGAGGVTHSREGRIAVGTHDSADVRLDDPTVSRFHCELTLSEGEVVLRDLGSRNGTRVDGVRVVEALLEDGARISVGKGQFTFAFDAEPEAVCLSGKSSMGRLVGASVAMRQAIALLERAAASDATVLLEGETGTGKELAAESIHLEGARRDAPFLVVDCGSIPPDLLESELFGHDRGAFTGATSARKGVFEAADGGTIFLDEVSELPLDLQPKLLRVLERRQIRRLGSNAYVPVDVRVVAATNRSLRTLVNERKFRSDLYYRLAVVEVRLPPLRARLDDLPLLVPAVLAGLDGYGKRERARLADAAFIATLAGHAWPGNVRELRNYLERCLTLRATEPLPSDDPAAPSRGPLEAALSLPLKEARVAWTTELERRYLTSLLARAGDNVALAARTAEVDRIYLYRLLWKHGLR